MDLASQDRHLVAQHDDLGGQIRFFANGETDQRKDAAERPVEEREGHSWMLVAPGASRQSAGRRPWMTCSAPTGSVRTRLKYS